jgi:hypothetical protein
MKNKEIFELRQALDGLEDIKGKSFAYAVLQNKDILDKEIETINKLRGTPQQEYIDYENDRQLLCITHSEKNENGEPVLTYNPNGTQSFKIIDIDKFNEEYKEIHKKYESTLKEKEEEDKSFLDFLEKDNEIILKKISIRDLPDDINERFLQKIKFMIS